MFQKKPQLKKYTTLMTGRPLPEIPPSCFQLSDSTAETSVTYDVEPLNSSSCDKMPPDNEEPAASGSICDELSDYDLQLPNSSNNDNLQQPDMSEIRVVLLGNSQSERRSVGNFILEELVFSPEEEPGYQPVRGLLRDKEIVLINTPDLLLHNSSEDKLREHVKKCERLTAPGPHVILLVLQPETFTEDHKQRLCKILKLFGEQVFGHSVVLLSAPKKKGLHFKIKNRAHPALKDVIRMCSYRCLWRKNLEHQELVTSLVQILKENDGEYVSYKEHS